MTSNKQQTAVEWLENQLKDYIGGIFTDTFEQAKEMHKKEIEDAELRGKEIIIIKHTEHGGGEQ